MFFLLFRQVGDHGFRGQKQSGDAGGILQRRACDLGRIDDPGLDHIDIFSSFCIVAGIAFEGFYLFDNDGPFFASIGGDLPDWLLDCPPDDFDSQQVIVVTL